MPGIDPPPLLLHVDGLLLLEAHQSSTPPPDHPPLFLQVFSNDPHIRAPNNSSTSLVMQIQMLAVLYGKEVELLTSIQYLGYLPPLVVGKHPQKETPF